ncbi:antibiotic biosynthesis monooxygenase [Streptomyces clavuligerus]|nr:antibiotic biosynthesis monooxygenase [Streptomyces clavuligerus]ANW20775.1 antibiotic biosynthesis monooxygenase [Streptomyces clavuligerus]AXU15401.1 antibiotic biosynthesis monooxygenase [Streptomyces clavuligerus]MBY6305495.1 antibiotic biosynthesis monooxygenase [Streptomyces clavuligerus]QCS08176.1 antibiotic biosynthesis monooxygenase [Streptomyces clavuligerus]QPJ92484.1 antibiotic biosynthesis monooxygenase [Streptomyces clavuligerus]
MSVPALSRPRPRPDFERPGVGLVGVSTWDVGTSERQRATLAAIERAWLGRPWPEGGPLSYTVHLGDDGRTLLHYSQWPDKEAYDRFVRTFRDERNAEIDAAVPGIERVRLDFYELYRGAGDAARDPGSIVIVEVEFAGPDAKRQREWVDTVLTALASDADNRARSGGISGWFHVGTEGDRVLNYAEWESADAHERALAAPGAGVGSGTPEWDRVHTFPGVQGGGVRRYTPGITLVPGA